MSGAQEIRFRRPTNKPEEQKAVKKLVENNQIFKEQVRKTHRPWTPSFSLTVRVLFIVRVAAAMYSNIDDCDEVFNFWEPLHVLANGFGFQTWELSPAFSLRSWAYILLHYFPVRIARIISDDKRVSFFAVRIFLGMICGVVEAAFIRSVIDNISMRVGRYLFFMLTFSAGMWNASSALLPSTFAMYTTTLAYSYAMKPSTITNHRRTLFATLLFATGAIVGWPFALALAVPFVVEELFVLSGDHISAPERRKWSAIRWKRLLSCGLIASLLLIPVVGIDSLAYGKFEVVPWNLVKYNIFGGSERGPNLYGTAPLTFYPNNLVLNFNILFPLALLSLPALVISNFVDRRRLGYGIAGSNYSHPLTVLGLRLSPFYIWLAILTAQPHKEERFMFPVYPLLCFNAAMTTYLIRGWFEIGYITVTKSPYKASQTSIFQNLTFSLLVGTTVLSISRVVASYQYYHAPLTVAFEFQMQELPRLLNTTGLLPVYPDSLPEDERPRIDLSPIKEFNLTLCYGKEWHRFPGHFLIPNGIRVEFVKSEFDGLLPGHFVEDPLAIKPLKSNFWPWPQTRYTPNGFNDLNREETSHYVPVDQCDYLVDLDYPSHPISSPLEPRYSQDTETWSRVTCADFLDARHSMLLTRVLWFPGTTWNAYNEFGEYCILKNDRRVGDKEDALRRKYEGKSH